MIEYNKEILDRRLKNLNLKLNLLRAVSIGIAAVALILFISKQKLSLAGGVIDPVHATSSSWTDVAQVVIAIAGLLVMGLVALYKIRKGRGGGDLDL